MCRIWRISKVPITNWNEKSFVICRTFKKRWKPPSLWPTKTSTATSWSMHPPEELSLKMHRRSVFFVVKHHKGCVRPICWRVFFLFIYYVYIIEQSIWILQFNVNEFPFCDLGSKLSWIMNWNRFSVSFRELLQSTPLK